MIPVQASFAQSNLPEVEIDGSVYQSLTAKQQRELNAPSAAKSKKQFAPVVLRPPKDPLPEVRSAAKLTNPDDMPFEPSLIEPASGDPVPVAPPSMNRPMLSDPDFGDALMERDVAEIPQPKISAPEPRAPQLTEPEPVVETRVMPVAAARVVPAAPAVIESVSVQPPSEPLAKPVFTASKTIAPGTVSRAVDVVPEPVAMIKAPVPVAMAKPAPVIVSKPAPVIATPVKQDLTIPPMMSRPVEPVVVEVMQKPVVAAIETKPKPLPMAKPVLRPLASLMTEPDVEPAPVANIPVASLSGDDEVPLEPIALLKSQKPEPQPAVIQPAKPVILAPVPDVIPEVIPAPAPAPVAVLPKKSDVRGETVVYKTPDAATDKPVNFEITSTITKKSGIKPAEVVTKTTPAQAEIAAVTPAPVITPAPEPQKIIKDAPVPPQRPNKNQVSENTVRDLRDRAMVETYTGMKHEADTETMKPAPRKAAAKEKVPAPRLSVADIQDNDLASQIVDMSADDVAAAMNKIAPAAGVSMSSEVRRASKPRIVREMGEWNRKSKTIKASSVDSVETQTAKEKTEEKIVSAPATSTEPVALPDNLVFKFKPGKSEFDPAESAKIDDSVISALKSDESTRIQIVAFASAPDGKEGTARRTSLSRALALRTLLVSKGIEATRMDVRALGMNPDQTADQDKVNMILIPAKKS